MHMHGKQDRWIKHSLVLGGVAHADGEITAIRYFWGRDLSGTLQGAGGIGGLLYLTINGAVYVPFYDGNGNVTRYCDANGNTAATYGYDAFGRTISRSGPLADVFRHRFSTKYHDAETHLYYYGYRFYAPALMRWLNRDPIGERGGENLYGSCDNNVLCRLDTDGCAFFIKRRLDNLPWIKWISQNAERDIENTELVHEQLIFEDSKQPSDYGYGPSGIHTNDVAWKKRNSLLGDKGENVPKYNCQDYADELRAKYNELIFDLRVRCECGLKTKGN